MVTFCLLGSLSFFFLSRPRKKILLAVWVAGERIKQIKGLFNHLTVKTAAGPKYLGSDSRPDILGERQQEVTAGASWAEFRDSGLHPDPSSLEQS